MYNAIIYKRKSTDEKNNQVLSLESQDRVIHSLPGFKDFNIVAEFEESKSAKKVGRPKFKEMADILKSGQADHILCWKLHRIARNPIDAAVILNMVDLSGLKIVTVTPQKTYDRNDYRQIANDFTESAVFSINLSDDTKVGIDTKIKMGIAPVMAPIGYFNDTTKPQGERDILVDSNCKRFELCCRMWEYFLTGDYTPPHILKIATDEWGLRQRNGKPLSRTQIYRFFTNIFYTGQYEYKGEIKQGIHTPMITIDEFNRAQHILGTRGRRQATRDFAFNGQLVKCACGSNVTMHERYRKVCPNCHKKYNAETNEKCPKCSTPAPEKTWHGALLHCTKSNNPNCLQSSINLKDFEEQVDAELAALTIPEEFIELAMKKLRQDNELEIVARDQVREHLIASITGVSKRLDNLETKYLSPENTNGTIFTDGEYVERKNKLQAERKGFEDQLKKLGVCQDEWLDTARLIFNFSAHAREWFKKGSKEQKRAILSALGLNPTLDKKILHIDLLKPFESVKEAKKMLESILAPIEPEQQCVSITQTLEENLQSTVWGRC